MEQTRRQILTNSPLSRRLIHGGILAVALFHAWHLRWVAEDGYISFRYARNLIEGHGLVFNLGERVEGYTNFLWTLLLAPGLAAGFGPRAISTWLGLAATAIAMLLLFRLHRHVVGGSPLVPVALLTLALNYTWACFATSGLETSLLGALVGATLLSLIGGGRWRCTASGALTALAMMTRPDTVLLVPSAAVFLVLTASGPRSTFRALGAYLAPLVLLYLPYYLWRVDYYGHAFPNTYYAKAAYLAHYEQGLIYVWEFLQRYFLWIFLPLPLVSGAAAVLKRRVDPAVALLSLYVGLHTFYVIRIGGDFMEGRFLLPVLPATYLLIERGMRAWIRPRAALLVALVLLASSTAVNRKILEPGVIGPQGITDERSWVPVFELWLRAGEEFGEHLPEGTPVATDAVGAFGWSSGLPLVDTLGLVDETVAHQPVGRRSRPGHDKAATPEYLRQRSVAVLRDGREMYGFDRPPELTFAGDRYYLLSTDPAVVNGFRAAAIRLAGIDQP